MRTTAARRGDKYVINASKVFISNGGYADWYTVYAKTDKDAGHRGISPFLVPRDDTVTVDKHEDKMGLRASTRRRSASTRPRCRRRTCWARRTTASSSP
jgi:acyl-CoA dehydrogenase